MNAKSSTTLDLSGPRGDVEIGIKNVLNIDDSTDSARLGFAWRFKNKQELSVDLYQLQRDGRNTAASDFDFTTEEGDFVEVDDDWKGSIDWQFNGPRLFIGARF
jgi:hypothetical protein